MYLTQGLHRALRDTPDRPMTVYGDRVRTVAESVDRVSRLAGALRGLGVRDGDRVGILSLNSDRYHEVLLAVWWVGGVVNPVNIRWSPVEMAFSLSESQTEVLFVDDTFAPLTPVLRDEVANLRTIVHCGESVPDGMLGYEQILEGAGPVEDVRRGGRDLAGLFYTGGTSGFPKGVMLSHQGILTSALGSQASCQTVERGGATLVVAPMFHLAAIASWITQVTVGGTQVIVPMFDPVAVLTAVQRHRPSATLLVPTMIQTLVDHPDVADYDLSSLRWMV